MAFLFSRSKQNSISDLCRKTNDSLLRLQSSSNTHPPSNTANPRSPTVGHNPAPATKEEEDVARSLSHMKVLLQGTPELSASPEQITSLVHSLLAEDTLVTLSRNIHLLPFESRKDAQVIFSHIFRYKAPPPGNKNSQEEHPVLTYVLNQRPEVIINLCEGYGHRESAMPCGGVLREIVLKHDTITALILYHEPEEERDPKQQKGIQGIDPNRICSGKGVLWKFFDWIEESPFEVSADAFSTFRDLLTHHKRLTSHFLVNNSNLIITPLLSRLISSPSYVTKRQSLSLLSTLLLTRENYYVMTQFVSSAVHLKQIMNLLRDDARMVNYEAFHVFKIFIANPEKSEGVMRILVKNKERLLRFLPGFLKEREGKDGGDAQFEDEKAYCIRVIKELPDSLPPVGVNLDGEQQHQGQGQGQSMTGGGVAVEGVR